MAFIAQLCRAQVAHECVQQHKGRAGPVGDIDRDRIHSSKQRAMSARWANLPLAADVVDLSACAEWEKDSPGLADPESGDSNSALRPEHGSEGSDNVCGHQADA